MFEKRKQNTKLIIDLTFIIEYFKALFFFPSLYFTILKKRVHKLNNLDRTLTSDVFWIVLVALCYFSFVFFFFCISVDTKLGNYVVRTSTAVTNCGQADWRTDGHTLL